VGLDGAAAVGGLGGDEGVATLWRQKPVDRAVHGGAFSGRGAVNGLPSGSRTIHGRNLLHHHSSRHRAAGLPDCPTTGLPAYRVECLLGRVLGLRWPFGAVLPTFIGAMIKGLSAFLHLVAWPAIERLRAKVF